MQLIKPGINIDFIGKRKIAISISIAFIIISFISLALHKGPRYGIDFVGGTLIQLKFHSPVKIDNIKSALMSVDISKATVQEFGDKSENEYLINTEALILTNQQFQQALKSSLKAKTNSDAEIRRVEKVGPQVGSELREKALLAIFYAVLFISIYISGRFELKWGLCGAMGAILIASVYFLYLLKVPLTALIIIALIITIVFFGYFELKFAMGALLSLIHDVIMIVGCFSILNKEIDLPIIASILTIAGYSLNDTIIVFDRIRENLKKYSKEPLEIILNKSVNETLSRTVLTSLTALAVVLSLFFLGGGIIHDFSFALIIGIVVGTYSSVYIASPILLAFHNTGKKRK
ncbi:MAG: protein translocase subunit SecF [Desulfobacterales bacterium]|nr:protein translocase subunit SecF [Desulfobacterales bacterium]